MKRKWRLGRIILAVMLLGIAALVIYSWPLVPRWNLKTDVLVGFDEKRHLLLTMARTEPGLGALPVDPPLTENTRELRGYDLHTGKRVFANSYDLSASKITDGFWLPMVSPDYSSLVIIDRSSGILLVFDLETRTLRCHFGIMANCDAFGFSADGKYFAACSPFTNKLA